MQRSVKKRVIRAAFSASHEYFSAIAGAVAAVDTPVAVIMANRISVLTVTPGTQLVAKNSTSVRRGAAASLTRADLKEPLARKSCFKHISERDTPSDIIASGVVSAASVSA